MSNGAIRPTGKQTTLPPDLVSAGLDVGKCYQCGCCSNGCPISPFFDLQPMQVVRLAGYGEEETLLSSKTIWLCASCETCTTRCPNEIDIAGVMDFLRARAREQQVEPAEPGVVAFHHSFLRSVRRWGRTYELGMMGAYKLRSGDLTGDLKLGCELFLRGRFRLLPEHIEGKEEVRRIIDRTAKEERE